ncbi:MAG: EF-hand domain pair [Cyanobacteria bacterium RYN_339]|nr:EF-hand domain pair [Cyanobacteria bacterium RYN_339]
MEQNVGMKIVACLIFSALAIVACSHAGPRLVAAGPALESFAEKDLDHDGQLSAQEFARGLDGLATPREVQRIFQRMDLDHDGQLGTAEYFPEPRI